MAAVVEPDLLVGRRRVARHPAEPDRIGVGGACECRWRIRRLDRNHVDQDDEHGGEQRESAGHRHRLPRMDTIAWIHELPLPLFQVQAYPAAGPGHAP
jgi:hypothetical protein